MLLLSWPRPRPRGVRVQPEYMGRVHLSNSELRGCYRCPRGVRHGDPRHLSDQAMCAQLDTTAGCICWQRCVFHNSHGNSGILSTGDQAMHLPTYNPSLLRIEHYFPSFLATSLLHPILAVLPQHSSLEGSGLAAQGLLTNHQINQKSWN